MDESLKDIVITLHEPKQLPFCKQFFKYVQDSIKFINVTIIFKQFDNDQYKLQPIQNILNKLQQCQIENGSNNEWGKGKMKRVAKMWDYTTLENVKNWLKCDKQKVDPNYPKILQIVYNQ